MNRRVLTLLLSGLLILGMAGCRPSTGASPEAGAVTLRLWVHQNPTFEAGYQALIDAYHQAHPNVTITMETFDYSTYIQTLQTAMPAGEEADIVQMFGTWVCGYAGRLAPAPADVMTVEQAQQLYYAAPIGGYICDDTLYGLPLLSTVTEWQVVDPVLFNDTTNWVGTAFFSGQAAIAYIGPWAVSMGLTDYPDFGEFGYFVLPHVGDEPIFVADSGWGLSVSPNSEHQDIAWDFVRFAAAEPANALQWNITSSTIPAIPENAESAELAQALPWITEELSQLPYGRYLGTMPDRDQVMYQIIYPHILNVLQQVETVDQALAAIDAEANATFR